MYKLFFVFVLLCNSVIAQKVEQLKINLSQFPVVRDFTLSEDGTEAYFTAQSLNQELSQIMMAKNINGKWTEPVLLPFCDEYNYLEPFLNSDGTKLFFASNKPVDSSLKNKLNYDIWFVSRKTTKEAWGKPINLGSPVNTANDEFYPTLSKNNNLYFTMDAKQGIGKDDIYFCKWDGKIYSKAELLDSNINSNGYEFNAFISPNETFLLYSKYNAKDGLGSGDLYIATKNATTGQWQPAKNLGNIINTPFMEYCPYYHSKTNTLYFTSKRNSLIGKKFTNAKDYANYITGVENGASKIYMFPIKL